MSGKCSTQSVQIWQEEDGKLSIDWRFSQAWKERRHCAQEESPIYISPLNDRYLALWSFDVDDDSDTRHTDFPQWVCQSRNGPIGWSIFNQLGYQQNVFMRFPFPFLKAVNILWTIKHQTKGNKKLSMPRCEYVSSAIFFFDVVNVVVVEWKCRCGIGQAAR